MKHQTPFSKLQAPTSKLQRNTKDQAPISRTASVVRYTELGTSAWFVSEPAGGEANKHAFDLEERTARFGEAIIRFAKKIPRNPTNDRLIGQLVGCGTSIGGNYCEANEGVSKKDFRNTIGRCVKEAKETKIFLRMIAAAERKLADEARELYCEGKELHLIFASIFRKAL